MNLDVENFEFEATPIILVLNSLLMSAFSLLSYFAEAFASATIFKNGLLNATGYKPITLKRHPKFLYKTFHYHTTTGGNLDMVFVKIISLIV